jgi:hypothetical protein
MQDTACNESGFSPTLKRKKPVLLDLSKLTIDRKLLFQNCYPYSSGI